MRPRLRVLQLAQRHRPLDEDRAVADVAPAQRQGFLRPQSRVRQDRHQHGVPLPAGIAKRLHGHGRQRPDLTPRRPPDLPHDPRRVAPDPLRLQRPLQDAPEQVQRVQHRHATRTGRDPLRLPTRDHLRRQLTELVMAQVWRDVQVVQTGVVLGRLGCQRDRVRLRPRLTDVLIQCLLRTRQQPELAEATAAPQLVLEGGGVGLAVERSRPGA
jgi:hypothetical protein